MRSKYIAAIESSQMEDYLNKKISDRSRYLAHLITLYNPRRYLLNYRTSKLPELKSENMVMKIKEINQKIFLKNISIRTKYQKSDGDITDGLFIIKPFYNNAYLDNFYNLLDDTYNNNKNDASFEYQNHKLRTFMFDNMSIIQTLNHALKLNSALAENLFKYVIDMMYILQVPKEKRHQFLNRSKMTIVRYEQESGLYTHIDNIKRGNGPVVTFSLGPSTNVYDLVPIRQTQESVRIFFPKGSMVILDGEIRYHWAHAVPKDYKYFPVPIRYSVIVLTDKYIPDDKNCFHSDIYNEKICSYYDKSFFQNRKPYDI